MKILVVGPSWIGDMVMSQSLYQTLKIKYPKSIIEVIAPEWSFSLLSYMPEIDLSILMPIGHKVLKIRKRFILGCNLRKNYYDRAYILPNSFKSALIPFFAGIPHRIGWLGEMRYGLLNDIRILDEKVWPLMVERYVALAYNKNIACNTERFSYPILRPKLQLDKERALQTSNDFNISDKRPLIGFCPGAEFSLSKCWPYYYYAELAKKLINMGFQIVLLGSTKDRNIGNKIVDLLSIKYKFWCHNLTGKTKLEQAIELIAICKIVITNDSGLMHVAAAVNCPLVALYGPTNPSFTPPLSDKSRVVYSPTKYHKFEQNSIEKKFHQNLLNITPQNVIEEINKIIPDKINNFTCVF